MSPRTFRPTGLGIFSATVKPILSSPCVQALSEVPGHKDGGGPRALPPRAHLKGSSPKAPSRGVFTVPPPPVCNILPQRLPLPCLGQSGCSSHPLPTSLNAMTTMGHCLRHPPSLPCATRAWHRAAAQGNPAESTGSQQFGWRECSTRPDSLPDANLESTALDCGSIQLAPLREGVDANG